MRYIINNDDDCTCPSYCSIPPGLYSLTSSLLGILLINYLSIDQQNAVGNFLVNIGQSLLTAAAQGQAIESGKESDVYIRRQLDAIKKKINELESNL